MSGSSMSGPIASGDGKAFLPSAVSEGVMGAVCLIMGIALLMKGLPLSAWDNRRGTIIGLGWVLLVLGLLALVVALPIVLARTQCRIAVYPDRLEGRAIVGNPYVVHEMSVRLTDVTNIDSAHKAALVIYTNAEKYTCYTGRTTAELRNTLAGMVTQAHAGNSSSNPGR